MRSQTWKQKGSSKIRNLFIYLFILGLANGITPALPVVWDSHEITIKSPGITGKLINK